MTKTYSLIIDTNLIFIALTDTHVVYYAQVVFINCHNCFKMNYDIFQMTTGSSNPNERGIINVLVSGYYYQMADPTADGSWQGRDLRPFSELPYHLVRDVWLFSCIAKRFQIVVFERDV